MKIALLMHNIEPGGGIQERRNLLTKFWRSAGHNVYVAGPYSQNALSELSCNTYFNSICDKRIRERYTFLYYLVKGRSFIKEKEFDVLLAPSIPVALALVILNKLSPFEIPIISSFHNPVIRFNDNFLKKFFIKNLAKFICKESNAIICVSQGIRDELISFGNECKKIHFIPNPVIDDSKGSPIVKPVKLPPFSIVAIGRLTEQKGFDILIKAFALLDDKYTLFIIGDGPDRAKLIELSERLNVSARVNLVGYEINVLGYLNASCCFVLSSRFEGFGNVIVEALYSGTPVVAIDCPYGPSEILAGGRYGVLVNSFEPKALAMGINSAIQDGPRNTKRWEDYKLSSIATEYIRLFSDCK